MLHVRFSGTGRGLFAPHFSVFVCINEVLSFQATFHEDLKLMWEKLNIKHAPR